MNAINSNKTNIIKKALFVSLGFTSTTAILAIPVAGLLISFFSVTLIIVFWVLLWDHKRPYKSNSQIRKYYIWSAIGILSSLFGALFFMNETTEWAATAIGFVPKILMYLILLVFLAQSQNIKSYCNCICNGLLWGCVFNLLWANLDAIIYYTSGYSVTNELFKYYISASDTRYGMISLTYSGIIRSCGLNVDPANIGLFVPFVALYALKRNMYILYILSIISIFASLSHTALFSLIIVTLFHLFRKKNKLYVVASLSLVVVLFAFLISFAEIGVIMKMQDAFVERTEQKASDSEDDGLRKAYWRNFPKAMFGQISSIVIGTGYGTASYPYLSNKLVNHEKYPYDPEQTYFSMYFNIGLGGLLVYLSILFGIIRKSRKLAEITKERQYSIVYSATVGFSIAALGYHYTMYSVMMLMLIVGILLCTTCLQNRDTIQLSPN